MAQTIVVTCDKTAARILGVELGCGRVGGVRGLGGVSGECGGVDMSPEP